MFMIVTLKIMPLIFCVDGAKWLPFKQQLPFPFFVFVAACLLQCDTVV